MGGVRTGVGGGSRGKLGVQSRTVQVTAVAIPTYRCVEAPSPWGGREGAMRQRRMGYGTDLAGDRSTKTELRHLSAALSLVFFQSQKF